MNSLAPIFDMFTNGLSEMDGRTFVKLLKECGIIDKNFSTTDADLVFTQSKTKGQTKISFHEFELSLEKIANRKSTTTESIKEKIAASRGPTYTGTKAQPTRFHDDKSSYTGVHAHGGPSTVDANFDLSNITDRSPANVRGMKI